ARARRLSTAFGGPYATARNLSRWLVSTVSVSAKARSFQTSTPPGTSPALRPRLTAWSFAVEGALLGSDSGEAGWRQRCRVEVQRPDRRQQRGELAAQPGNPVQDDDFARAQRLAVPGLDAVAGHGGAPAGQVRQPGAGRRHLDRAVEGAVRRAPHDGGLAQPPAQRRPRLPPLRGGVAHG